MKRKALEFFGSMLVLLAMLAISMQAQTCPQDLTCNGYVGSLGIGTANPEGVLNIASNGDQWSSHNYGTNLIIKGGTIPRNPAIGIFDANNANPWAITTGALGLAFSQMPPLGDTVNPATIRLILNPTGNVGIGTTAPTTATGGLALHVDNSSGPSVLRLGDGAVNGAQWEVQSTVVFDNGALNFSNITDFTNPMTILRSGNVGIGVLGPSSKLHVAGRVLADGYDVPSDLRLKEDITPLTGMLDKLDKIHGVSFQWNTRAETLGHSTGRREVGVIAQEVATVFPELVTARGPENYRSVDYSKLTAILLEAVKELKAEVKELKTENQTLKNKMAGLENR